ncbi:MAG: eukaryotic-like serine/threonine-protein kinase [Actinomycetota bacterium]|nr:eukaryotic-like serine/threonine-protein kinase [Actinomycetota bacterium]
MELVERTVAGRYRLLDRLGSGGMGTVWRASDTVLDRDVAVKEVTFPHGVSEEEREVLRERTRREARAAARLDHPSAVTVYDVAEENGTPYLVMELVDARTLAEVIRTDGPLPPKQTAEIGLAVLGALEAAHEQGIVHRDVKPGNVLLRADGRVVLTDFGIATFTGDASITSTGLLLGSPSYMAPERAKGEQPGPPSDLWSLGATLFTAVEGRAPYDRGEPLPTLTAVVAGEHEPYVAAGPLAPVLDGLLECDPALRLDAAGARAALERVLSADATTVDAPMPHPAPESASRRSERTTAVNVGDLREEVLHDRQQRSRSRVPLILGALAALLVAGLTVLLTGALTGGNGNGPTTAGSSPGAATKPTSAAAAVPAGWRTYQNGGWTVAVPASYLPGSFNGDPQYKDPATGRTLRVSTTAAGGGKSDAVQDRRAQAQMFAAKHPSYQEVAIKPVEYRGWTAADWEFTYSDGGAQLHAFDRVFVVAGRGYSLFFQTHGDDSWSAARNDFDTIASTFQP